MPDRIGAIRDLAMEKQRHLHLLPPSSIASSVTIITVKSLTLTYALNTHHQTPLGSFVALVEVRVLVCVSGGRGQVTQERVGEVNCWITRA